MYDMWSSGSLERVYKCKNLVAGSVIIVLRSKDVGIGGTELERWEMVTRENEDVVQWCMVMETGVTECRKDQEERVGPEQ